MRKRSRKRNNIKDWFKAVGTALLLFWLLTVFVIQIHPVTDSFMSATLLPGDFVVVNKISYGPRFPITPLSVPFAGEKFPFSGKNTYLTWIQLSGFRLPGFSSPGRNDLILMNYPGEPGKPVDYRSKYVKRCIGLPGDTVFIKGKNILVNGEEMPVTDDGQFAFRVITRPKSLHLELLNNMGIFEGNIISDAGVYRLYMTKSQADSLEKLPFVTQVREEMADEGFGDPLVFPQSNLFIWNHSFFGPLVVPAKDRTIPLTKKTLALYRTVIEQEKNKIELLEGSILINGQKAQEYTFKSNYYFVLDDNLDNSKDSRYWGFLPENHIVGKVNRVAFSINRQKGGFSAIRWNRFFKRTV